MKVKDEVRAIGNEESARAVQSCVDFPTVKQYSVSCDFARDKSAQKEEVAPCPRSASNSSKKEGRWTTTPGPMMPVTAGLISPITYNTHAK